MLKWPGGPRKTFPEVVHNTCSYIKKSVYLNVVTVKKCIYKWQQSYIILADAYLNMYIEYQYQCT